MKKAVRLLSLIFSFMMLTSVLSVFAGASDEAPAFYDVGENDWFFESVEYVNGKNFMQGVGHFLFNPGGNLTRAMAVTILYRFSDSPGITENNTFSDVRKDGWYTDPVSWAQTEGIVKGRSETEFDPDSSITRAEFATVLSRYMTAYRMTVEDIRGGEPSDIESVPEYAKAPVTKMFRSGIINGREGEVFDGGAQITRAETAAMIERYDKKIITHSSENGVWRSRCVTQGWVLNALYELEGCPDVADWSPYDGYYQFAIYNPDDPEWVKTQNELEFWNHTVKEKWYYKALLWARETRLYYAYTWHGRWDSEYVESDFESSFINKGEIIELLYDYCNKTKLDLPEVRSFSFTLITPGGYDLDAVRALYEAGVVSSSGSLIFDLGEVIKLDEAMEIIGALAELKK